MEKYNIKTLTLEHLLEIANISTGGYSKSEFASDQKEIETGGYGKRRLIEWIYTPDNEKNYFEMNGENDDRSWHWYAWCIDSEGVKHDVHCLDMPAVVDYCDQNNINVRNK